MPHEQRWNVEKCIEYDVMIDGRDDITVVRLSFFSVRYRSFIRLFRQHQQTRCRGDEIYFCGAIFRLSCGAGGATSLHSPHRMIYMLHLASSRITALDFQQHIRSVDIRLVLIVKHDFGLDDAADVCS